MIRCQWRLVRTRMMVSKRLTGGAKGLKIQNFKNLVLDKKFVIKNNKFITITFFNKSIRLWFCNDGAIGTIRHHRVWPLGTSVVWGGLSAVLWGWCSCCAEIRNIRHLTLHNRLTLSNSELHRKLPSRLLVRFLTVQPVQFPIQSKIGIGLNISHWDSKATRQKVEPKFNSPMRIGRGEMN